MAKPARRGRNGQVVLGWAFRSCATTLSRLSGASLKTCIPPSLLMRYCRCGSAERDVWLFLPVSSIGHRANLLLLSSSPLSFVSNLPGSSSWALSQNLENPSPLQTFSPLSFVSTLPGKQSQQFLGATPESRESTSPLQTFNLLACRERKRELPPTGSDLVNRHRVPSRPTF